MPATQALFSHHRTTPGVPFVVIPDTAMYRIVGNFVRGVNDQGCWSYGRQVAQHYPSISFLGHEGTKRFISGNRLALMLVNDAPITPGLRALHTCCNARFCVNPAHLYEGTQADNVMDAYLDGRRAWPARPDLWRPYAAHARDRAAREGRTIRCTRFFCESVQEELRHAAAVQVLHSPRAA